MRELCKIFITKTKVFLMPLLLVIVPRYNEEKALPFFYAKAVEVCGKLKKEFSMESEF